MDEVIAQYGDNNSGYDGKEFRESISKLHREERCNTNWSLQISESVRLSQSHNYGRLLLWICDQTSNAKKYKLSTVAPVT